MGGLLPVAGRRRSAGDGLAVAGGLSVGAVAEHSPGEAAARVAGGFETGGAPVAVTVPTP